MKRRCKDFEIRFYEQIIQRNPKFIQALECLGEAYTRRGFYQEGLNIDRRLAALCPDNPMVRSEERRVGKECRSRWSPYH